MPRLLRHAVAITALPTTVTVVIPLVLALTVGTWSVDSSPVVTAIAVTLGSFSLVIGLILVGWTIFLFDREGDGTLAPWDSPNRLVLRGPYRHVRNPMISGVLFILLAEALALRSPVLLVWFAVFFAINQTYIPLWEEPDLRRRFGSDYDTYRRHVHRWIPRVHGWHHA